jgi:NAD(P)-dependent dehydrogenase (short-subunit alcohol dehydrogenase family)
MRLKDKVALVIGASRGSGKQIALELAKEGADIVVAARTERPDESTVSGTITQTAKEITALGRRALPVKVDLAVGQEIEDMYRIAIDTFGHIDILVHSVQHMGPGYLSHFLQTSPAELEAQLKVNLLSAMHATRLVAPQMIERGGGTIIVVTSAAAWIETSKMPGSGSTGVGYPTSKAGLNRFVWAVEKELRPHNVAVIALDPGFTLSEHVREGAVGNMYFGLDLSWGHGVEVPAKTAHYLCTVSDPMSYSGKIVVAEDFVKEHNLVPAAAVPSGYSTASTVARLAESRLNAPTAR